MANTIPCPNPTCTHDFSLAELQSAAQLLCPKCGFKMQGKGPAAKPAPKPAPARKPPPAPKPAASQPKPAAPPLAAPVPAPAPPEPPAPAIAGVGPLIRTPAAKTGFRWSRLAILVLAIGFAASFVITAIVFVVWFFIGFDGFRNFGQQDVDGTIHRFRNHKNEVEPVFALKLARSDWSVDNVIASAFEPIDRTERGWYVSAWKSEVYDFWFALVVKDYGMHKPRDAEVLRIGIEKLEGHFGEDVELGKAEPTKFGTLPAQKIAFRGVVNQARWLGECQMFFQNGVAYWLFLASPELGNLQHFSSELPQKHITILSDRRGWREQPFPTETFATADGKIEMTAPKGVWTRSADPKSVGDPTGILLLSGRYLREKDNRKNALVVVFTMEKKDSLDAAFKSVRDYLDEKTKAENENYKLLHAPELVAGQKDTGSLEDVGNKRGRMVDLKLHFQDEPQRYNLLSVVNEPDGCYAILGSCDWKSRTIWRQDFLDVLRTVRIK